MNNNFKRTFDTVKMSPECQEKIRSKLSSRVIENQKEGIVMNKKIKVRRILVLAAVLVFVFVLAGFTYGNKIIDLLGGGRFVQGTDENENSFSSVDTGFEEDPVVIRNNQVYFVLDGSNKNITNQCSNKTYYQYESTDDEGRRHVILIGGNPDSIGWAEFVWDSDGMVSGSNASYQDETEPQWLTIGKSALGQ